MLVALYTLTAAAYLVACLASGAGLALGSPRAARLAIGALVVGALLHGVAFSLLHTAKPPPPLTDPASAASFMAWIGTLAYLAMLRRAKVSGLAVLVAPLAFLGVFLAALRLPQAGSATTAGSGSVPHAHVLLASAGFALLGPGGPRRGALPGRAPPAQAPPGASRHGPALARGARPRGRRRARDRLPAAHARRGDGSDVGPAAHGGALTGSAHEIGALVAWAVYALLVLQRFAAHQGARRCAVSALAGFALLSALVVGVEMLA